MGATGRGGERDVGVFHSLDVILSCFSICHCKQDLYLPFPSFEGWGGGA
jgi:hypothetical protein